MLFEFLSYPFFKNRLKKKMDELYESADPWGSAFISEVFEPWIREQHDSLAGNLRHCPVLDAGGGEGHFIRRLHDLAPSFDLVDLNPTAIKRARNALAKLPCRFFLESLDNFRIKQNEYYGAIWCFSILTFLGAAKHPAKARQILFKLWCGLKPGGLLLAIHPFYSETEKEHLIYQLSLLGGENVLTETRRVNQQSFLLQSLRKN